MHHAREQHAQEVSVLPRTTSERRTTRSLTQYDVYLPYADPGHLVPLGLITVVTILGVWMHNVRVS